MKYIILSFFLIIIGCENEPEPCKCDLLADKEKYFIKSGNLIETNSNKKTFDEGKELEVEISVSGDPNDLVKKLGKINANGKIRVPLIDFDKYEYIYEISREDNAYDRNIQLYFLVYCSSYSSYHKKNNNCEPSPDWESKIENLRKIYLPPEEEKKSEIPTKTDRTFPKNPSKPSKNLMQKKVLFYNVCEILDDASIKINGEYALKLNQKRAYGWIEFSVEYLHNLDSKNLISFFNANKCLCEFSLSGENRFDVFEKCKSSCSKN